MFTVFTKLKYVVTCNVLSYKHLITNYTFKKYYMFAQSGPSQCKETNIFQLDFQLNCCMLLEKRSK